MEWSFFRWYRNGQERKNLPNPRRLFFPVLSIAAMSGMALACSLSLGGPTAPAPAVAPDPSQADINAVWSQAYSQRQNGQWVVILTETQLTTYLQTRLAENQNIPLHQVQVLLRDGKIQIFGLYQTDYISASVQIVIQPVVREDGTVDWQVSDAQFGPAHLPAGMLSTISDALNGALSGQSASVATGFQIKEVLIGDGQIAIRCQGGT